MNSSNKGVIALAAAALATFAVVGDAGASDADQGRKPFRPVERRNSTLDLVSSRPYSEIVRERSPLAKRAIFHADPQLIDSQAVILFEALSEGPAHKVSRWRCIAIQDVAECLGSAVAIAYLPDDEQIVLRVTVVSSGTTAGRTLLAERDSARRERDMRLALKLGRNPGLMSSF